MLATRAHSAQGANIVAMQSGFLQAEKPVAPISASALEEKFAKAQAEATRLRAVVAAALRLARRLGPALARTAAAIPPLTCTLRGARTTCRPRARLLPSP